MRGRRRCRRRRRPCSARDSPCPAPYPRAARGRIERSTRAARKSWKRRRKKSAEKCGRTARRLASRRPSAPRSRQLHARMPYSTPWKWAACRKIPSCRRAGKTTTRRSDHAGCVIPVPARPLRTLLRRRDQICPARAPPSALSAFYTRRQDACRTGALGLSAFSLLS